MIVGQQAGVAGEEEDEARGGDVAGIFIGGFIAARLGEVLGDVDEDVIGDAGGEGHDVVLGVRKLELGGREGSEESNTTTKADRKATAGSTLSFVMYAYWLASILACRASTRGDLVSSHPCRESSRVASITSRRIRHRTRNTGAIW